ncbi:hypothetical protein [Streptomyces sp. MA5143a]|uniref:hypothetical protein n=1 Tax=Streptomyces sp. MA5143a TaxID=2083010 RepID=UPI000D2B2676|nr:hypothetical protein [Streptomyces sp. MA5143a]SPF03041.1 hypothetical protein SMA5143A_3805 [Streptomyces sp. MA5143a]
MGSTLRMGRAGTAGASPCAQPPAADRSSLRFRLLHIRDTMNVVAPAALPARLEAAGSTEVAVAVHEDGGPLRFRARCP